MTHWISTETATDPDSRPPPEPPPRWCPRWSRLALPAVPALTPSSQHPWSQSTPFPASSPDCQHPTPTPPFQPQFDHNSSLLLSTSPTLLLSPSTACQLQTPYPTAPITFTPSIPCPPLTPGHHPTTIHPHSPAPTTPAVSLIPVSGPWAFIYGLQNISRFELESLGDASVCLGTSNFTFTSYLERAEVEFEPCLTFASPPTTLIRKLVCNWKLSLRHASRDQRTLHFFKHTLRRHNRITPLWAMQQHLLSPALPPQPAPLSSGALHDTVSALPSPPSLHVSVCLTNTLELSHSRPLMSPAAPPSVPPSPTTPAPINTPPPSPSSSPSPIPDKVFPLYLWVPARKKVQGKRVTSTLNKPVPGLCQPTLLPTSPVNPFLSSATLPCSTPSEPLPPPPPPPPLPPPSSPPPPPLPDVNYDSWWWWLPTAFSNSTPSPPHTHPPNCPCDTPPPVPSTSSSSCPLPTTSTFTLATKRPPSLPNPRDWPYSPTPLRTSPHLPPFSTQPSHSALSNPCDCGSCSLPAAPSRHPHSSSPGPSTLRLKKAASKPQPAPIVHNPSAPWLCPCTCSMCMQTNPMVFCPCVDCAPTSKKQRRSELGLHKSVHGMFIGPLPCPPVSDAPPPPEYTSPLPSTAQPISASSPQPASHPLLPSPLPCLSMPSLFHPLWAVHHRPNPVLPSQPPSAMLALDCLMWPPWLQPAHDPQPPPLPPPPPPRPRAYSPPSLFPEQAPITALPLYPPPKHHSPMLSLPLAPPPDPPSTPTLSSWSGWMTGISWDSLWTWPLTTAPPATTTVSLLPNFHLMPPTLHSSPDLTQQQPPPPPQPPLPPPPGPPKPRKSVAGVTVLCPCVLCKHVVRMCRTQSEKHVARSGLWTGPHIPVPRQPICETAPGTSRRKSCGASL